MCLVINNSTNAFIFENNNTKINLSIDDKNIWKMKSPFLEFRQ